MSGVCFKLLLLLACVFHACTFAKTSENSSKDIYDNDKTLHGRKLERTFDDEDESPEEFTDEFDISYLECTEVGCTVKSIYVEKFPGVEPWQIDRNTSRLRTKRRIFLPDNRMRIAAGSVARHPFSSVVAIRVNGEVRCSGVAIRPTFFLTAAHCLLPDDKGGALEVGALEAYNVMAWVKAKRTMYPRVWKKRKLKKAWRHDYAVIETEDPLDVTLMAISFVGRTREGFEILKENKTFLYISAFDDAKRSESLNMRFCRMEKISKRRIYSKCDTGPKTAGAGVYVRMRNQSTRKVERKVIAIATGDYGLNGAGSEPKFSAALRISQRMFGHICILVTGDFAKCGRRKQIKFS